MGITKPSECSYRRFYEDMYGCTALMFTYIVSCESSDLIKFGKSNSPEWRLVMMQTGCPFKLKIEWAWPEDIERDLHLYFADRRVCGEWFHVPVREAISIAAKLSKLKWLNEQSRQRLSVAS